MSSPNGNPSSARAGMPFKTPAARTNAVAACLTNLVAENIQPLEISRRSSPRVVLLDERRIDQIDPLQKLSTHNKSPRRRMIRQSVCGLATRSCALRKIQGAIGFSDRAAVHDPPKCARFGDKIMRSSQNSERDRIFPIALWPRGFSSASSEPMSYFNTIAVNG